MAPQAAPASPMQAAMASAGQPVPMPQPRPQMSLPPGASPMSFTPPASGPTPPPNFYNGPGSQNFGMGNGVGTNAPPGIPNGANIGSALKNLFSGNTSTMFQPQAPQASQSNPVGNILPFIKNLLSGN